MFEFVEKNIKLDIWDIWEGADIWEWWGGWERWQEDHGQLIFQLETSSVSGQFLLYLVYKLYTMCIEIYMYQMYFCRTTLVLYTVPNAFMIELHPYSIILVQPSFKWRTVDKSLLLQPVLTSTTSTSQGHHTNTLLAHWHISGSPQRSCVKCRELPSRRFASICNSVSKLWSRYLLKLWPQHVLDQRLLNLLGNLDSWHMVIMRGEHLALVYEYVFINVYMCT